MLATQWHTLYPKMPADSCLRLFRFRRVRLTPLIGVSTNQDLRLDAQSAHEVSRSSGRPRATGVRRRWSADSNQLEFLARAASIADAWSKGGAQTR